MSIILLQNVNSNSNGAMVIPSFRPLIVAVWATDFSSGTVTLEATPNGGSTWIPLTRNGVVVQYTANSIDSISGLIPQGMPIRAVLSGAGTPSNVNAVLYENVS